MTRHRIFIAMHYLELGGAETALIGLLDALDFNRVEVDLFLYSHRGELMNFIPAGVNLLPEIREYSTIESPMIRALRKGCFGVVYGRLKSKVEFNKYRQRFNPKDGSAIFSYVAEYVTPHLPKITDKRYDLAISFLTPHNIVLEKVDAGRKICWIHTDYTKIDVNTALELPIWERYDNIISISPSVTESFCTVFPSLRGKIIEIENILSPTIVKSRSEEYTPDEFNPADFNILSIGRFTYPKNFDNIPDICNRIIRLTGIKNLRWYIIGFGGEEEKIRQSIRDTGMANNVIILGKKENPYPYIKACDLYVQPSRYEGKSVTVREAQMLGKPVVITDYPTSKSQFDDNIDGIIAPLDNTMCAEKIAKVILNNDLRAELSHNASIRDYSNRCQVDKIYSLL